MFLIEIPTQLRIYLGMAAMLILFASFIIAFVISQRRKLQFHRKIQAVMEERQNLLASQNKILEEKVTERTHELDDKNKALEQSLIELRNTQQQLVHREKLASLGELTAGIAHEIKNPLNFVNNFSEVSAELTDELLAALQQHNNEEAIEIASDLKSNLQKINNHGKRADNIVKGMLSHARTATSDAELTDINQLTDECVQLSYQGFRARKKGFTVEMHTHYDKAAPEIVVNAQDVGRAMINICNNALYAIEQRSINAGADYVPALEISTIYDGSVIRIAIADNGTGIEDTVLSKLFQPFFTTKPTGEGTGLGLSMSYDIITHGHSGFIDVTSALGKGTTFTISLPAKQ